VSDLYEAAGLAVRVGLKARHLAAGEEELPVTMHVPSLIRSDSVLRGQSDLGIGNSRCDRIGRIDEGEVLPDDLRFGVAEDVLGAGVPSSILPSTSIEKIA
jgi:hypothetical protein